MTAPKLRQNLQNREANGLGVKSAQNVRQNIINMFVHAVLQTLRVQCSFDAKPLPSFMKGRKEIENYDISAIIAIVSPSFIGSLVICFPEKTFLAIMTGMLGTTQNTLTEDLKDGSRELVNIIFGAAKKAMTDAGYQVDRALPKLISPEEVDQLKVSSVPPIVVPFQSDFGGFHVEFILELVDL